ncbi:histidinol dehydrogenase [Scopulibacillus daqui]|uniref:Histidinol dehydrogenase n=1 Tax=Scopulibacillus daqui TaxID=1469162 RepID=A0ABS2PYQ9_9BACL|nr:histidinol dehydrogenase [Scopulibacillus daqui]MBM7645006.1 histidinol dehydrogenase [Scopulibacillus daqui]
MEWIKNQELKFLNKRKLNVSSEREKAVREIIANVKKSGDAALREYTIKFDNVILEDFKVTKEEIDSAYHQAPKGIVDIIKEAAANIKAFHEKQKPESWLEVQPDGSILGQRVTPLDAVGVYVPGGTAAYPSSVLMGAIPALAAGVEKVVIVSPPQENGTIADGVLIAANEIGLTDIYKVGGAQAIAALAYGTETMPKVDKIVGPGNQYVALAKREVFGTVDIDSLAGPSEIVVLADDSAEPNWIAADLLSQAEHDPMSMAVLVTPSEALGKAVESEMSNLLSMLPRKEIAERSIKDFGKIILVEHLEDGAEIVNQLAPEHLEIMVEQKAEERILKAIKHAGAIFIGSYSTEPVGDYFAGPNHIIPTNGTAKFGSPLSVESFIKRSSMIRYSREALIENAAKIAGFARYEGLEAHARAIEARLKR